jgi:hypothetical protein
MMPAYRDTGGESRTNDIIDQEINKAQDAIDKEIEGMLK